MSSQCPVCGCIGGTGRYCPECGVELPDAPPQIDPLIGQIVAERFEILEVINEGGMGRVYRATQRILDRAVAIKFIHPALAGTEAVAGRFFAEARAASRLSHPNVVSILDFGRMPAETGGQLYLVMELLSGSDLATALGTGAPMPLFRVGNILRQVLAALGEAHHAGIVHRDIKPENIVLEPRRDGADYVKVIDFGIARLETDRRLTQQGHIVGTPDYMAPEQAAAGEIVPATDLYSVGVVLFQMLTGRVPFEGNGPMEVIQQHLSAERPDPRRLAPDRSIPDELAEVCMRAMHIDPAQRYPDAESMAAAVGAAVAVAIAPRYAGEGARPSPRPQPIRTQPTPPAAPISVRGRAPAHASTLAAPVAAGSPAVQQPVVERPPVERPSDDDRPRRTPPPKDERGELPLVGRAADIAWASAALDDPRGVVAFVFEGRDGMGRSRLLREVGWLAEQRGALVVRCDADLSPLDQVSLGGLRKLIAALRGPGAAEAAQLDPDASAEAPRALASAARDAIARANGRRVVVLLDDCDRLDPLSRAVVHGASAKDALRGLVLFATCAQAGDWPLDAARTRSLQGLSASDVRPLLGDDASALDRIDATDGEIAPLHVAQLLLWRSERDEEPPRSLVEIVRSRIGRLSPARRRLLHAVAITGGGSSERLARVHVGSGDLHKGLVRLVEDGFVVAEDGIHRLAHRVFGDVALTEAAEEAVADVHVRAAELVDHPDPDLRLHHAVRGRPDVRVLAQVEELARARAARRDTRGTIAALREGIQAARTLVRRGDREAGASAWVAFADKLAVRLMTQSRFEEAQSVLREALEGAEPRDARRTALAALLAAATERRPPPA